MKHRNTTRRTQIRAEGRCHICGLPNDERGQRGLRKAHQWCRKLADCGYSFAEIRRQQADAPLVGLA